MSTDMNEDSQATELMKSSLRQLKYHIELALERRRIWADLHLVLLEHLEAIFADLEQQTGFSLRVYTQEIWEGQPEINISFGKNPVGLAKPLTEQQMKTNLLIEEGARLRIGPTLNGELNIEFIGPRIEMAGQINPIREPIARTEPESLHDLHRVNTYIETFLELSLQYHWSTSPSPIPSASGIYKAYK